MIGLAFAALLAGVAQNDDAVTLETASRPLLQSGILDGCELDFKTAFKDTVYRQGQISIVNGSLLVSGFNSPNKRLVVALKVKTADVTGEAPNFQQSWSAPFSQWIMVDRTRTNRTSFIRSTVSENGALLSVYRFDDNFTDIIGKLYSTNKLMLTFNRRDGGSDVLLPVEFSATNAEGKSSVLSFGECFSSGSTAWQKRFSK